MESAVFPNVGQREMGYNGEKKAEGGGLTIGQGENIH
jgi:hypothetical protein